MAFRKQVLYTALLVFALIFLVVGCSNNDSNQENYDNPPEQTENTSTPDGGNEVDDGEEKLEDSEAGSKETVSEGGNEPSNSNLEEEAPKRTVAEISSLVSESPYIDKSHVDSGLTCESCHGPLPEADQTPEPPETEKCLSCHGGDYKSLGKVTQEKWGDRNPHKSHQGELDCSSCHKVHDSFEFYCSICHSWSPGDRFK